MRTLNYDDVKLCNCARCGQELLGDSMPERKLLPQAFRDFHHVAGRIKGRPYCPACLKIKQHMEQQVSV